MPTAQSTASNPSNGSSNKNKQSSSKDSLKNTAVNTAPNQILVDTTNQEQETTQQQQPQSDKQGGGNKTPQEQPEFIKQALIIIEKKVRNLEKRRIKLEEYRADQKKGQKLNEDQLSAVSKYDEVMRTLELTREMEKQFIGLANDAMKQQKKQAKKEQLERDEAIKEKLKEAQKFISILDKFGDNAHRNNFLNETNGACKITQQELNILDEFDMLIQPSELGPKLDAAASEVADHLICLIESKNKPITQLNTTYADLRKLFDRLSVAPYWTMSKEVQPPLEPTPESVPIKQDQEPQSTHFVDLNKPESAAYIDTMHHHHLQQNDHRHLETGVFHQQNTSDDFVLVSNPQTVATSNLQTTTNNEYENTQKQSPQQKTFFTTLNPADLSTQFLNRNPAESTDEASINFLQDSEIQQMQQQQGSAEVYQSNQPHQGNNYQDYGQQNNENKDSTGGNFSGRGGYQQNKGRSNNYPPRQQQQQQRYPDDRRGGNNNMRGGNQGSGGQFRQPNPDRQNGGGGYRSNNPNGQRPDGQRSGGGGGYYRGGGNRPAGGNAGGQRGGYRAQHQEPVVQN